jgi:hypothetical protein
MKREDAEAKEMDWNERRRSGAGGTKNGAGTGEDARRVRFTSHEIGAVIPALTRELRLAQDFLYAHMREFLTIFPLTRPCSRTQHSNPATISTSSLPAPPHIPGSCRAHATDPPSTNKNTRPIRHPPLAPPVPAVHLALARG